MWLWLLLGFLVNTELSQLVLILLSLPQQSFETVTLIIPCWETLNARRIKCRFQIGSQAPPFPQPMPGGSPPHPQCAATVPL